MKRNSVYALGKDRSWLEALKMIGTDDLFVRTVFCESGYLACLGTLPGAEPDALLLIDANGQPDIINAVCEARKRGWQKVVVVAAAPSWREAYRAIHDGGAIDYWVERSSTARLRREILAALEPEDCESTCTEVWP